MPFSLFSFIVSVFVTNFIVSILQFLSVGAVFYFSLSVFVYICVCFVCMGFEPATEYNE